jgi:ABC-type Fe3+/spermidine/putrescine transport system ATPase subunit
LSKLKLESINKLYGDKQVLEDISFEINEGEFVSILGPSGCGKTTLLKIIAGLEEMSSGKIFFDDIDYSKVASNKRDAVIVFQDYGLFPHMTVEENIEFGLKVRGAGKEKRRAKTKEMLELIQLEGKEKSYPRELSGGQKQRVAIARALTVKPKVLLLDEPFSSLDANLKESMRDFVVKLQKKLGFTVILVTHDKEEAFMTSHRVAIILEGRLQDFAAPREIYVRPRTKAVSDFIGEANYIDGHIKNGVFYSALGTFKLEESMEAVTKEKAVMMIRYDRINILSKESVTSSRKLKGNIVDKKYAGKTNLYRIRTLTEPAVEFLTHSNNGSFEVDEEVHFEISDGVNNLY